MIVDYGSSIKGPFFLLQIHPLSICSNELSTELFPYGWVGVMRLEQMDTPCMSLFQQVDSIKRLFYTFRYRYIYWWAHAELNILVKKNWRIIISFNTNIFWYTVIMNVVEMYVLTRFKTSCTKWNVKFYKFFKEFSSLNVSLILTRRFARFNFWNRDYAEF